MNDAEAKPIINGTVKVIDGKPCVYYDGYWIRYYKPPPDSLAAKKKLIDNLKKRLFHHTEPGINTPGENLETARRAYDKETDPARKRVNGTMLAGALFNRATDIFTTVVDLESKGVKISPDNELLKTCGDYFQEALELGKSVKHYSGQEGVDELWGEPFKAFALPISDFYESRYIKIAQTMRDMDNLEKVVVGTFAQEPGFEAVPRLFETFADWAKTEAATMRKDTAIFEVWPAFVAAGEALLAFQPTVPDGDLLDSQERRAWGMRLLREGKLLLTYLAGVRTPMPKSTQEFLASCEAFTKSRENASRR